MKNLKRALSLVLSAAMMVGMMAMGTAAADFKDTKGHANDEAAQLMAMIGVMEGDGTNFNPDKVVTRDEMAVVMCNLLDLKLNGAHPFTDVASWADKYVAAIYSNGYTAGKSATTFGGSDKLTTAEAALMIMKTLGYFEFQGEFGSDWKLATVKQATKLDLLKNVNAGINDYLTRGEVAEMVMNALNMDVVVATEKGGMTIEGNGITVTEKAEYDYANVTSTTYGTVQLKEKLFGIDLEYAEFKTDSSIVDAFGRPAVKWTYKGGDKVESVLVTDAPAMVFTTKQTDDNITKALQDYTYDNEPYYMDGKEKDGNVEKADLAEKTGNGVTVEIYADKLNVTRVVIVNEYLDKVTAVTAANETTGAKRNVTVDGKTFETESFARKDMVIYTKADNVIKSMKLAEIKTGKVTAKADSYIKLDGVTIKANDASSVDFTASSYALGNTVKVYVDSFGFVIGLEEVVKTAADLADYVVLTKLSTADTFGKYQAKVLYADGTTATVTIDEAGTDVLDYDALDAAGEGVLYTTKKTADGVEFYAAPSADEAGFDSTVDAGMQNDKDYGTIDGYKIADDAVFFVEYNDNGAKYKIMNGAEIKKLADNTVTVYNAYLNKDAATGYGIIELAYVYADAITANDDTAYGFVVADVEIMKNADDKDVASITFWNGKETVTVLTTDDYSAGLAKGDFFAYELNTKGELDNVAKIVDGENDFYCDAVVARDGKFLNVEDSSYTYEITKDTVIIYVDTKNDKGVAEGEIELADEIFDTDGETVLGYTSNVVVKANTDDEVVVLFVDVNNKVQ